MSSGTEIRHNRVERPFDGGPRLISVVQIVEAMLSRGDVDDLQPGVGGSRRLDESVDRGRDAVGADRVVGRAVQRGVEHDADTTTLGDRTAVTDVDRPLARLRLDVHRPAVHEHYRRPRPGLFGQVKVELLAMLDDRLRWQEYKRIQMLRRSHAGIIPSSAAAVALPWSA